LNDVIIACLSVCCDVYNQGVSFLTGCLTYFEIRTVIVFMKKLLLIAVGLCFWLSTYSQQESADFGLYLGGGTPFGDFTKTDRLNSVQLNYGLFYRYILNSRLAVRINARNGFIQGRGQFNGLEAPSFRKNVMEFSSLFEINYLDFLLGAKNRKFSPYIYAGVGFAYYTGPVKEAVVTPTLPIGFGVKYALAKRWGVGAECSLHKLFDDKLDNLDDPYRQIGMEPVSSFWHNNDWIGYAGVKIWYKFYSGKRDCPAYDSLY
jgi:hypothetical protein